MENVIGFRCDCKAMYDGLIGTFMGWQPCLSELIDNSLDAGASKIELWIGKSHFTIDDNGVGSHSLEPFFGLGTHRAHARASQGSLGVYGVGGTHAMLAISADMKTSVTIETRTKTEVGRVMGTWDDLADAFNAKQGVTANVDPPSNDRPTGCRIELVGKLKKPPEGVTLASLVEKLSFCYSKAIDGDARKTPVTIIVHTGTRAKPGLAVLSKAGIPDVSDEVAEEFEVNGKKVRLRVGIVPEGQHNARPGLHYRYSYRVVLESSVYGCGGYSANRIFGFVDLMDGWRLDLHKDGITDRDADALYDAVFQRIESLLKKAKEQSMFAQSNEISAKVEGMVNAFYGKTAKAKRSGKRGKLGTAKPTGNGSKHTDARHKQPGNGMPGEQAGNRIRVFFEELPGDVLGDFVANAVRLNTLVSAVRRARDGDNAVCIFSWVLTILALADANDQLLVHEECARILKTVGLALSDESAPALNGKPLKPELPAPTSPPAPQSAAASATA